MDEPVVKNDLKHEEVEVEVKAIVDLKPLEDATRSTW